MPAPRNRPSKSRLTPSEVFLAENVMLSPEQVAAMCGLSVKTIYEFNCAGIAPPRYRFGRLVRYKREDVLEWIAQREVPVA